MFAKAESNYEISTLAAKYPDFDIAKLFNLLRHKRPHGTESETAAKFLPESAHIYHDERNAPAAWAVVTDANSKTLFTSHLDTVHRDSGIRKVKYNSTTGFISSGDGTALGADDGAGVWLMLEMIKANVPGTYLFTVGEECGGIGAKAMADNYRDFLKSFDRAIAFDRGRFWSVITHQGIQRCCSDKFGDALADAFNNNICDEWGFFALDDTGVYTDTAEFTHLIPECTNLSVGYDKQHGPNEVQNLPYLLAMCEALLKIDFESLPTSRDPQVIDSIWAGYGYYGGYGGTNTYKSSNGYKEGSIAAEFNNAFYSDVEPIDHLDIQAMSYKEVVAWVESADRDMIADLLITMADDLYIADRAGK